MANGEVCLCCINACCDIPSRRYSVAVVNQDTNEVEFHWLWAYSHKVTHVPRWPKKRLKVQDVGESDGDWHSESEDEFW